METTLMDHHTVEIDATSNHFIQLTEIIETGKYWWKKTETQPLFLNVASMKCFRKRQGKGTEIETKDDFINVEESIVEVIELINRSEA